MSAATALNVACPTLGGAAILQKLAGLAQDLRTNEVRLLPYLTEVDTRRLYLELGYSSLFVYCTKELKFPEGSASRYISSARAAQRYPQIYALLASGAIHTTAIGMIAGYLTGEHAEQRLELACGKTKREIEALIAAWNDKPTPQVKDQIRVISPMVEPVTTSPDSMLRFPDSPTPPPIADDAERPKNPVAMTEPPEQPPQAVAQAQLAGSVRDGLSIPDPQPTRPRRVVIRFEASGELAAQIEHAKSLLAHLGKAGSLSDLFGEALAALIEKRDPMQKAARRAKRQAQREAKKAAATDPTVVATNGSPRRHEVLTKQVEAEVTGACAPSPVEVTAKVRRRYVPADVRGDVWLRSGGRCEFVSTGGRRCEAITFLELDHIEPFALGGETSVANGRILCAAHNQHRAEQTFGLRRASVPRQGQKPSSCRGPSDSP